MNAGKVYSSWNFVKVLVCKARNDFFLLIRKREWSCRHCSDRASVNCSRLYKMYQYLSLRLCTITRTRLQKRSEQCGPVGMGPWGRQCLTLIFQYQDSTLIIICKTLLTTVSVLHLIHVHTSPRQDVPRPQQSLEFDFEILTLFSNFRTCSLSTPRLPGGHNFKVGKILKFLWQTNRIFLDILAIRSHRIGFQNSNVRTELRFFYQPI